MKTDTKADIARLIRRVNELDFIIKDDFSLRIPWRK